MNDMYNSAQYNFCAEDHAVLLKSRKRKGSFLPRTAPWQLKRISGMALNEVPSGISQQLIEMSSEGEIEYALMKHYYKLLGINYEFPNTWLVSQEEKRKILSLREKGLTFKEIGKKVGCNEDTAREVINDFRKTKEIKNDRRRRLVSEEEKKEILVLRREGLSYEKIAVKVDRNEITVIKMVKIFEEEGTLSSNEYNKPLSEEEKKKIISLWEQDLSYKEIAEKTGRSKASISRVIDGKI